MASADIYTAGDGQGLAPEIQMLRMASGHMVARAVQVFATLGIADLLRPGPLDAEEIARRTNTNTDALTRLLHYLGTLEVVRIEPDGRFGLTALGKTLCANPSPAIRDYAMLFGSDTFWAMYGDFPYTLRTGKPAFEHLYGEHYFKYLSSHPEDARVFNSAMQSSARISVPAKLAEYPFGDFSTIVDVGGGEGGLLTNILKLYPHTRGTLFDTPCVAEQVEVDPAIEERLEVTAGDFMRSVPAGADAYILRRILHDWNDCMAGRILQVVREAIPAHGKLLIIELAAPGPEEPANNWHGLDLMMMLNLGGRERTEADLKCLLAANGFALTRVVRTNSPHWIVEAMPV